MEFLKNTSIIRLIRRAGVKSLSKNSFNMIKKNIIYQKLEEIIILSIKFNSTHNKKIISQNDIYKSLQIMGYNVTEISCNKEIKYSFKIYINKLLKHVFSTNEITQNAKSQINSFLCIICNCILKLIIDTKIHKNFINIKDITCVLYTVLSGELLKNSILEGEKAVENFSNFISTNDNKKRISKQQKANIIFSPSIIQKIFKNNIKISNSAKIFITAILEYLTFEIFDLAIIFCKNDNRTRITIRDIELAIRTDVELSKLFNKLNITFLGGGVVPTKLNFLNQNEVISKIDNKKIIKNIKKEQENNNLIFSKSLFEKVVRNIYVNKKINNEVFIILQYFIEQYCIDILQKANYITLNSNRIRLIPNDINIVYFIKNNVVNNINQKQISANVQDNQIEYLFEIQNNDENIDDEEEYVDIYDSSDIATDDDVGLDINGI